MYEANKIDEKNGIKYNLIELLLDSSIHGIPNAFRSKNTLMKIIWITCFLISTGACAYSIIKSFQQYFEFEVVTQVRVIPEIPSEMPIITICNINPLTTNYSLYEDILKLDKDVKTDSINYNVLLKYNSPNVSNEDRKKIGYSLEEILLSCKFGDVVCNASDFEWKFDSFYGNCYEFNTGRNSLNETTPIKKLFFPGYRAGLQIDLYAGMPDFLDKYYRYKGVLIFVRNKTSSQRILNEILVPPGKVTSIAIMKTFIQQMEHPYSNCRSDLSSSDSILYKTLRKANLRYNKQDCFSQCYQFNVEKYCKCYNPLFLPTYLNKPCLGNDSFKCLIYVRENYFEGKYNDECERLCPLECDRILFTYTISNTGSMSKKYFEENYLNHSVITSKYPNKNVTFDEIKEDIVNLRIYLDALLYTDIKEMESQTVLDLISNVGGTLGLFIGISLLSFIEILEIVFEFLMGIYKSKKKVDIEASPES